MIKKFYCPRCQSELHSNEILSVFGMLDILQMCSSYKCNYKQTPMGERFQVTADNVVYNLIKYNSAENVIVEYMDNDCTRRELNLPVGILKFTNEELSKKIKTLIVLG